MSDADLPIHLRPIEADIVYTLCDRARALIDGTHNYYVGLEIEGFKESRTPWDARRLARALAIDHLHEEVTADLFKIAYLRGDLAPDISMPFWCPAHEDHIHRYDQDAMTAKDALLSSDVRVQWNALPPRQCACGRSSV